MGTITFSVKKVKTHAVGTQCAVGVQYALSVSAKRSTGTLGYTVGSECTVCIQYAVGVRVKKVNSHSGLSKYGWWGLLPLVQKGQTHTEGYTVGAQYAVGMQYTLSVSAKLTQWGMQ